MKTKPEPPKTTAAVTTTAKLTIRGQTFEMDLSELEHIYGIIGQALGKKKPEPALDIEKYKKALEETHRHPEPPITLPWPPPHYVPPINKPSRPYRGPQTPPYEVWCSVDEADASVVEARRNSPRRTLTAVLSDLGLPITGA